MRTMLLMRPAAIESIWAHVLSALVGRRERGPPLGGWFGRRHS